MKTCKKCGSFLSDSATSCPHCKTPFITGNSTLSVDKNNKNKEGVDSYSKGDYEHAAECFEMALKIAPNDGIIYSNLGDAHTQLYEKGKIQYCDLAIHDYEKALDLGYSKAAFSLAIIYDPKMDGFKNKKNPRLAIYYYRCCIDDTKIADSIKATCCNNLAIALGETYRDYFMGVCFLLLAQKFDPNNEFAHSNYKVYAKRLSSEEYNKLANIKSYGDIKELMPPNSKSSEYKIQPMSISGLIQKSYSQNGISNKNAFTSLMSELGISYTAKYALAIVEAEYAIFSLTYKLHFFVDSNKKVLIFCKYFGDWEGLNVTLIPFSMVRGMEVIENGKSTDAIGRAVKGAFWGGDAGAIIGAQTANTYIKNITARILLKDINNPYCDINIVDHTKKLVGSDFYVKCKEFCNAISATIGAIVS